jgi:hypothetical protein
VEGNGTDTHDVRGHNACDRRQSVVIDLEYLTRQGGFMMLPVVDLVRLETNLNYGTFGVLRIQKEVFCVTLEPPSFQNMKNLSCIPAGQYKCGRVQTVKIGETFEVRHVPNRFNILFHAGNLVIDTEGCILLAQHYGKLKGNRAVLNSGATFKGFMGAMLGYDEFCLTIKEEF